VNTRPVGGSVRKFCRACGEECVTLAVRPLHAAVEQKSFASRLGGAFLYPLKGDGVILLVTGTVFYSIIGGATSLSSHAVIIGGLGLFILGVLGTGYLIAYLRRILLSSAMGEGTMPDWPDLSDLTADILSPCFQLVGTVAACFLPAVALGLFVGHRSTGATWALTSAVVYACAYFPMSWLAVTMFDSVAAVNPMVVVPSIIKIPLEYFLTVVLFGAVLWVRRLGQAELAELLVVPVLPAVLSSFISLYLLTVEMRILGLLYFLNKGKLGWFKGG
jgi:hypothetical protein